MLLIDPCPSASRRLPQPLRRGLHLHAAQHARRVPAAKLGRFDLHAGGARGGVACFRELRRNGLQPISPQRRHFARHAVMAQAIRPIDGEVEIEQRTGGRLRESLDRNSRERQPFAQLLRRKRNRGELLQPVVKNFHRGSGHRASGKLPQEAHVVLKEELHVVDPIFELRKPVHAQAEGVAGDARRVVIDEAIHRRIDHARAEKLDPA